MVMRVLAIHVSSVVWYESYSHGVHGDIGALKNFSRVVEGKFENPGYFCSTS